MSRVNYLIDKPLGKLEKLKCTYGPNAFCVLQCGPCPLRNTSDSMATLEVTFLHWHGVRLQEILRFIVPRQLVVFVICFA
jgi:hypothetical protein